MTTVFDQPEVPSVFDTPDIVPEPKPAQPPKKLTKAEQWEAAKKAGLDHAYNNDPIVRASLDAQLATERAQEAGQSVAGRSTYKNSTEQMRAIRAQVLTNHGIKE